MAGYCRSSSPTRLLIAYIWLFLIVNIELMLRTITPWRNYCHLVINTLLINGSTRRRTDFGAVELIFEGPAFMIGIVCRPAVWNPPPSHSVLPVTCSKLVIKPGLWSERSSFCLPLSHRGKCQTASSSAWSHWVPDCHLFNSGLTKAALGALWVMNAPDNERAYGGLDRAEKSC